MTLCINITTTVTILNVLWSLLTLRLPHCRLSISYNLYKYYSCRLLIYKHYKPTTNLFMFKNKHF